MAEVKSDYADAQPVEDLYHSESLDDRVHFTEAEEKAVIRKLDWRLLPFVLLLYTLSILDRSNLGNAKLAGMAKDIDLGGLRYNWLGTIFYIAYILFQPAIIGWKQFPAHRWATFVVFYWGVIATVQAAATSWAGLMVLRFLLGTSESMFGPGVPLYLSFFYPREKVGFRQGVFVSGAALANAYGSALAYGITQIKGTLAPWKILFLIEGLPTICVAAAAWFILPDSIVAAKFLSPREKQIATSFVGRHQTVDSEHSKGIQVRELLQAFKDPKTYLPGIMYFSVNVSFASLPLFIPTIISEIGAFTTIESQGLSAPPYVLVFFTILLASYFSDKCRLRGPFITVASLVAAVGFILLATTEGKVARYLGVFLAVQIFVCVSLLLAWTSNMHATESKRAGGYVVLGFLGQCGPLLGTNVFPAKERPYYRKGMWISCAFCLLVTACSITLSLILRWENSKMEADGSYNHEEELGEMRDAPNFDSRTIRKHKYIL